MKLLKNLIITIFAAAALSSCGGNSPENVIMKYRKAGLDLDFETMKKYVTKEMHKDLDKMQTIVASFSKEEKEEIVGNAKKEVITIVSSKINDDGNTATVALQKKGNDAIVEELVVSLVKEDGEWKLIAPY